MTSQLLLDAAASLLRMEEFLDCYESKESLENFFAESRNDNFKNIFKKKLAVFL